MRRRIREQGPAPAVKSRRRLGAMKYRREMGVCLCDACCALSPARAEVRARRTSEVRRRLTSRPVVESEQ